MTEIAGLFDGDEELDEDLGFDSIGEQPINGLTNSARRFLSYRRNLLGKFSNNASAPLAAVLSNLKELERFVDLTYSNSDAHIGSLGFALDEQTTADLLKIAGACSAMRQQILIIADTVSEFSNQNK